MTVFNYFGFSRGGLVLYWDRVSVKNSNLNGLLRLLTGFEPAF